MRTLAVLVSVLSVGYLIVCGIRTLNRVSSQLPSSGPDHDSSSPFFPSAQLMQSEDPIINTHPEYISATELRVAYGKNTTVPGVPDLNIHLSDITHDQRCPVGANCSTAGRVSFVVEASYQGQFVHEALHLDGNNGAFYDRPSAPAARPEDVNAIHLGEYIIYAADLRPYPQIQKTTAKNDYVLTIFVDTEQNIAERIQLAAIAKTEIQKNVSDYQKYYPEDINTVHTPDGERKRVIFFDALSAYKHEAAKKYSVFLDRRQEDGWIVTNFEEQ